MLTILADMFTIAARQEPHHPRGPHYNDLARQQRENERREIDKARLRGGAFTYW